MEKHVRRLVHPEFNDIAERGSLFLEIASSQTNKKLGFRITFAQRDDAAVNMIILYEFLFYLNDLLSIRTLGILKFGLSSLRLFFTRKVKINLNFSNENKRKLKYQGKVKIIFLILGPGAHCTRN